MTQTPRVDHQQRRRWRFNENLSGYLFISPAILGFCFFIVYPLAFSAYYALTDFNGLTDPHFIGLANFTYMFTKDQAFWNSLRVTFFFALVSIPTSLFVGLLLALLLNRKLPGVQLFRTLVYLPVVLPVIAVLTMWKYIYDPLFGLANQVLTLLHLPTSLWLSGEQTAIPAIVIIGLWGIGATTIIFLAGLQAVPQEFYEAARIDGANTLQLFRRITLPMISPILFLQLILQLVGTFQAFNQPKLLTNGGPNNATNLFMFKIYTDGFTGTAFPEVGYATAEVWILFIIIMVVTALTFRTSATWVYSENDN